MYMWMFSRKKLPERVSSDTERDKVVFVLVDALSLTH